MGDRYRWCVWCGADCRDDSHTDGCPRTTNVFPADEGTGCTACREAFSVGEHYTRLETGGAVEIICLGCAAQALIDEAA